jgi:hypothetical protein
MRFRHPPWQRLALAGASLVLLAISPARAQVTEKKASRALRSGVRGEIKDTRVAAKAAVASLSATLDALIRDARSGTFGPTQEAVLGVALQDFRDDMELGSLVNEIEVTDLVDQLVTDLGSPMDGSYPAGFYRGDGSTLGRLDAGIRSVYEKALRKVDKKLRRLATQLERNGIGFTWRMIFSFRDAAWAYNAGVGAEFQGNVPGLAFVYALSHLAVADDGALCIGGRGPNNSAMIDIELSGGHSGGTVSEATMSGAEAAVFHCFSNLEEGNYLIQVSVQGSLPDSRYTSLGVR